MTDPDHACWRSAGPHGRPRSVRYAVPSPPERCPELTEPMTYASPDPARDGAAQTFEVEQNSMVPTILEGEYVLIDKVSPRSAITSAGTSWSSTRRPAIRRG